MHTYGTGNLAFKHILYELSLRLLLFTECNFNYGMDLRVHFIKYLFFLESFAWRKQIQDLRLACRTSRFLPSCHRTKYVPVKMSTSKQLYSLNTRRFLHASLFKQIERQQKETWTKGQRSRETRHLRWTKQIPISLGLTHAGIIWSMKTLQLDHQELLAWFSNIAIWWHNRDILPPKKTFNLIVFLAQRSICAGDKIYFLSRAKSNDSSDSIKKKYSPWGIRTICLRNHRGVG